MIVKLKHYVILKNDKQCDSYTPMNSYINTCVFVQQTIVKFCKVTLEMFTKWYVCYHRTLIKSLCQTNSNTDIKSSLDCWKLLEQSFLPSFAGQICCYFKDVVNKHKMIVAKPICAANIFRQRHGANDSFVTCEYFSQREHFETAFKSVAISRNYST